MQSSYALCITLMCMKLSIINKNVDAKLCNLCFLTKKIDFDNKLWYTVVIRLSNLIYIGDDL